MRITDKKELVKLISAFSTFDGGLYRQKSGQAVYVMNMRAENYDYIKWASEVINNIVPTSIKNRKDYNTDGAKRAPQMRLESRRHPFLTKLHSRIYIDRKKVIDPHMLKMMDAEMLAIIFMADGGSRAYKSKGSVRYSSSITLNTKGFSYGDNLILSKAIYNSTGILSNINKQNQYYYLNLPVKSHELFVRTVCQYITPSFRYKLERLAPAYWWDDDMIRTSWIHEDAIGD